MWQAVDAAPYRGSRIELSAQFRDRASLVFLFLRTQRATETELVLMGAPPQNIAFSSLGDSWVRFPVVAVVPPDADVIVFGVAVGNRGYVRIDDYRSSPAADCPLRGR